MIYYIKSILNIALSILQYSVIIECIASWIPGLSGSGFIAAVSKINAPFLDPIRKAVQKIAYGLPVDFSPIILFMLIGFVRRLLWAI